LVALVENALAESRPKIESTPYCLLNPIVKVVSERGASLRFRFHRDNEEAIFDNQQVPLFGGPKVARKLDRFVSKDKLLADARFNNDLTKEVNEAVHLAAACYCASGTPIWLLTLLLPLSLARTDLPIASYSSGNPH